MSWIALRSSGIDVLTTAEVGHQRLPDFSQLEFATAQGRVVYTANVADFARLHGQWMKDGRHHAGIIVRAFQEMRTGDQVRGLRKICESFESGTNVNMFVYPEDWIERTR